MDYPKYLFALWLIMIMLGGYVLISLGWIGFTGFMILMVSALPMYWLETYWRNQSIDRRIKKDKLKILPFRGWSFERLLYYQFILLIALSLPGLFFEQSEITSLQVAIACCFVIGLFISKYYRERHELQSYQLTKEHLKIVQYGLSKKVVWHQISGFQITGNRLSIKQGPSTQNLINLDELSKDDRDYILKTLRSFAQKKELPFVMKLEADPDQRPWYFEDWKRGILFIGATLLNLFLIFF